MQVNSEQLEKIMNLYSDLTLSTGEQKKIDTLLDKIQSVFHSEFNYFTLNENNKLVLKKTNKDHLKHLEGSMELDPLEGIIGRATKEKHAIFIDDFQEQIGKKSINPYSHRSAAIIPIANGELKGILTLDVDKEYCDSTLVSNLANHMHIQLTKAKEYDDLKEKADNLEQLSKAVNIDELTGLFKFNYFQNRLIEEISYTMRENSKRENKGEKSMDLCVMVSDIDHFKKFNDKYGHLVGNTVLKKIAGHFKNNVRPRDVVCRFGGEEIYTLLSDIGIESPEKKESGKIYCASDIADKINCLLRQDPITAVQIDKLKEGKDLNPDTVIIAKSDGVTSLLSQKSVQMLYGSKGRKFILDYIVNGEIIENSDSSFTKKYGGSKQTYACLKEIETFFISFAKSIEIFNAKTDSEWAYKMHNYMSGMYYEDSKKENKEFVDICQKVGAFIMMQSADKAMYNAKENGRNRCEVYMPRLI